MIDPKCEAGCPWAKGVSLAGICILGLAILIAPASVSAQVLRTYHPLYMPDEAWEWVGDDNAFWNQPGSWQGWDPAEVRDELDFGGPPGPIDSPEPPPDGPILIFGTEGGSPSVVDATTPGQQHWGVWELRFEQPYLLEVETVEEPDPMDPTETIEVEYVDVLIDLDSDSVEYELRGNTLFMGSGGIQNVSGAFQVIRNDIWLYDDMPIEGGVGLMLPQIGARIDLDTQTLTVTNWVNVTGPVIEGPGDVMVGDGALGGNLYLNQNQAFTGQLILNNGRVVIGNEESLGQNPTVLVTGGAGAINRISGLHGEPLTLDYDFDLEAQLAIGGAFRPEEYTAISYDPAFLATGYPGFGSLGGNITLEGEIRLVDGNWGLTAEGGVIATHTGEVDADVHAFTARSLSGSLLRLDGTIHGSGGTVDTWSNISLVKEGTGRAVLGSANLFTGDVLLRAGTVDLEHVDAFGGAQRVIVDHVLAGQQATIRAIGTPFDLQQEVHLHGRLVVGTRHPVTFLSPITADANAALEINSIAPSIITETATITLNDTLTIGGNTDLEIHADISGTGGLTKQHNNTLWLFGEGTNTGDNTFVNGLVRFNAATGASLGGDTTVSRTLVELPEGTSLGGAVTLGTEGQLRGGGELAGTLTVNNRGNVRPQNLDGSVGTLNVGGDASFANGSEATFALGPAGTSDRIEVVGDVDVTPGATFFVVRAAGSFIGDGAQYTLMTANDMIPAAATLPETLVDNTQIAPLFLSFELDADAWDNDNALVVVAQRNPFDDPDLVRGRSNRSFAQILDQLVAADEIGDLVGAIDAASIDADTFNAALRAENPVIYTAAAASAMQVSRGFHGEVHDQSRTARLGRRYAGYDRFGPIGSNENRPVFAVASTEAVQFAQADDWLGGWRDDRYEYGRMDRGLGRLPEDPLDHPFNAWVAAYGLFDRIDSTSDRVGLSSRSGGVMVGMDYSLTRSLFVGVSAGYTRTDIDFREGRGDGDIETFRVGPYASATMGSLFIDASATWGYHDNDYELVGLNNATTEADFNAQDITVHVTGGYRHQLDNRQTYLIPTAAATYMHYRRDSFEEQGGLGDKRFSSQTVDSLESTLGVRIEHHIVTDGPRVVPNAFLGWSYEFLGDDNDVNFQFVGTPGSFTVAGPSPDRSSIRTGLGMNAVISRTMTGFLQYDGRFSSNESTHAITGGIGIQF